MRRRRWAGKGEEAGCHPGHPAMKGCSDGRPWFRKTASRSPGSPLYPAESGKEEVCIVHISLIFHAGAVVFYIDYVLVKLVHI